MRQATGSTTVITKDMASRELTASEPNGRPIVSVLTAGRDRPYALGIGGALSSLKIRIDYVGSDDVYGDEVSDTEFVNFINIRDQREGASYFQKVVRIYSYYFKLCKYAVVSKAKIFHILWNNKFELIDRTLLMLLYKICGRKLVLTIHNVNAGLRDNNDSFLNRMSLKFQYRLADHHFVHTKLMKQELMSQFDVASKKVTIIPFGINNTLPNTELTRNDARRKLDIPETSKCVLFFGNIAPYKGLHHLVEAMSKLVKSDDSLKLIVAGQPKGSNQYWSEVRSAISKYRIESNVIEKIEFIPDEEVEIYFKASDLLVLPYSHIFQSGVLFLGYSFGLPVLATDVGSLKDEIVPFKTGLSCKPEDPEDLANQIAAYFSSDLYSNLETNRDQIKEYANENYSWRKVAEITYKTYQNLVLN